MARKKKAETAAPAEEAAPVETPETTETEEAPASVPADDFAAMADEDEAADLDELEEFTEPVEPAAESAEAEAAETPQEVTPEKPEGEEETPAEKEAAEADTTEEEETPAAEPKAPAGAEEPAEPPSGQEPLTPEQMQERLTSWQTDVRKVLAEQHYALDEEMVDELRDTPETAVPKLMAKAHSDIYLSVFNAVGQMLPQMMQTVQRNQIAEAQNVEAFQKAWPLIDLTQHGGLVERIGMTYRQLNPTVSAEDFIKEVGAQAMIALRLQPATSGEETPEKTPKPFQPTRASGGPSGKPAPANVFEQMAMEEELDDLD